MARAAKYFKKKEAPAGAYGAYSAWHGLVVDDESLCTVCTALACGLLGTLHNRNHFGVYVCNHALFPFARRTRRQIPCSATCQRHYGSHQLPQVSQALGEELPGKRLTGKSSPPSARKSYNRGRLPRVPR
jgi:hypothetical protein